MFVMQTSAMKVCFQIAEGSFSFAKLSNISVTSKYLAGYFVLFSIKTHIKSFWAFSPYLNHMRKFCLYLSESPNVF